jgi:hypothetical protein
VDGKGKGGGLVIYWNDSTNLSIMSYGLHYIDTLIWDKDHHANWCCTFVYGEPRTQDRHLMWELLRRLKSVSSVPLLLIGDFNKSLWSFEQLSLRRRAERHMLLF